jgi:1-acyl-sn-glycerol-3-phosphate acyltransferase
MSRVGAPPKPQPLAPVYRLSRALLRLYFGGICRVRVENFLLPDTPFVISMNHRSALDMFLYMAILPRRIKFLAKKELLQYPILGRILLRWCVPVARGRYDRRALTLCEQALREGFVLSVFPEGTRHAALATGHGGAVLLASRTGLPIVPGAIIGRYGPLQRLTVRFGQPMYFPPRLTREERLAGTEKLMATIRALGATPLPPRRRRVRRWRLAGRRLVRRSPTPEDHERAG